MAAPVLPVGADWTYEVRWDGYRALAPMTASTLRQLQQLRATLTPLRKEEETVA